MAALPPRQPDVRAHTAPVDRHTGGAPMACGNRPNASNDCCQGLPPDVLDHADRRGRRTPRDQPVPGPGSRRGAGSGTTDRHDGRGGGSGEADAPGPSDRRGSGGMVPTAKGRSAGTASNGHRPRTRAPLGRGHPDDSHVRPHDRQGAEDAGGAALGRHSCDALELLAAHLEAHVGTDDDAVVVAGTDRSLRVAWSAARAGIGRDDLRFHDLRHSGLTWSAATGASVAELMRRAGHASQAAALRYQHATDERDRAIARSLAALAMESRSRPT